MAGINILQTNFTAGELSPRMLGRVDVERYKNGAETLENVLPLIHGGVRSMPALRFNAEAKHADRKCRLLRFEFSKTESAILEFGHEYIRFFNSDRTQVMDGIVPYEIATLYQESELFEVEFVGGADTIFLFHENHPIQMLRRFDTDYWAIEDAPLDPAPFAERWTYTSSDLVVTVPTVGTGRTLSTLASWLAADVGRRVQAFGGTALITGYTSTNDVTATIENAFPTTLFTQYDWKIFGSPMTTCTPSAAGTLGTTISLTLSAAGWRAADVAKHVSINGGLIELHTFTSTTVMQGTVVQEMESAVAAQAGAWKLMGPMWNSEDGYPRTGTFFQQRLIAGGSPAFPHTICGSVIGNYLNFQIGTDDDAAFVYDLDATEYDPVLHLSKLRYALLALTSGNEFTLTGGVEKPITPTNVQVDNPTNYGCNDVRPARVGNELIYISRTGKKLRAMGYNFENDSFASPDLSKLSEHITGDGIVDLAYQQEPESVLWCVRSDGVMVSMTIDREEGVMAWARHTTDGVYESVATVPTTSGIDEVWVSVKRLIDGNYVRYIESFDSSVNYSLHSAVAGNVGTPANVILNLDHLEGETVAVIADGAVMEDRVVSGGQITIERDCITYAVGLPSTGYVKTLNPELLTQQGSAQGAHLRIGKIIARVLDTACLTIDDQYRDMRQFGDSLLDVAVPTFTGDIDVTSLGWKKRGYVEIEQSNPLPFHLLAIIMKVTVSN